MANTTRTWTTMDAIVEDTALIEAVSKALAWHFWIPKDKIRAEVSDGWITLNGNVEWLFQKTGAEDAVIKVSGIRGVTNNIEVQLRDPERYHPHRSLSWSNKHCKDGR